ncbi:histidine kinase [Kribbella sp. NBC_01245]|uniref:sensor histidine kinase n=1 Tax=Kribbella sp. NBC_01245 TaxID=2903578 RepID=UPI002E2C0F7B|nr:histidine kinase [Kribbella sp. NBC_01245]
MNRARLPTLLRDLAFWLVAGGLVVLESVVRGEPWFMTTLAALALAAAVGLRRRYPLLALTVPSALMLTWLMVTLGTTSGVPIAYVPAISALAFLAGVRSPRGWVFAVMVLAASLFFLVGSLLFRNDQTGTEDVLNWFILCLLMLLFVVLPWFVGRYRAQSALLVSAGWERAERIEREQRLRLDEARLRERSRIAEDMHDSVGHELSLIALRAGALEVDGELPERYRTAAAELRQAAGTATERLGEIIGVLREPDEAAPTTPADESIAELVERAAASGLPVRLIEEGRVEPSPMLDRAAHRVVQEGLTNAAKHAPGAAVTVTAAADGGDFVLRIVNGPPTRPVGDGAVSGGHGLVGLAERVRLVGGTLRTGRTADGGFEVVARMPLTGGPIEPAPEVETRSESATELESVRRRARRGLVTAIVAPLALGAVVGVVALGYYLVIGYSSILRPVTYEQLRLGQTREELDRSLPKMEMLDPPSERSGRPAGADCEYYRPGGPFTTTYAFRLCFVSGRLASKDALQTGTVQPDYDPTQTPTPTVTVTTTPTASEGTP